MKRHQIMKPILPGQVPGLGLLDDYTEWLDDYLKTLTLRDRLRELEVQRERVRTIPVDLGEFRTAVLEAHERRRESAVNAVAAHLAANTAPNMEHRALDVDVPGLVPLDILEDAFARIGSGEGMTAEDRAAELERIDAEIRETEAELESLSPARFTTRDGDIREAFHRHWIKVQAKCNAPCSPRGVSLEASDQRERQAWASLGLAKHVNKESIVEPDPGPQF